MAIKYMIVNELSEIRSGWNELVSKIDKPEVFYTYEWIDCYLDYYEPNIRKDLCIVLGKEESDNLVCILPFILRNKTINFITLNSTDYNSILIDKSKNKYFIIRDAISLLLDSYNVEKFCLTNIPSSSELYLLQEILRERGYSSYLEESVITPSLSYAKIENKVHKKQMKNIIRREKRLKNEYDLKIVTKDELSEDVFDFIILHRNKKYADSSLINKNVIDFYNELAKRLKYAITVNVLYLNDRIVAAHLGFKYNKKFYYYIPAYDDKYSNDAVGMILLKHLIEEYEGISFDMLKGNEIYKFFWCDCVNMNYHLMAYKKGKEVFLSRVLILLKNTKFIRRIFGR